MSWELPLSEDSSGHPDTGPGRRDVSPDSSHAGFVDMGPPRNVTSPRLMLSCKPVSVVTVTEDSVGQHYHGRLRGTLCHGRLPWITLSREALWNTLSRATPWNTLSRAAPWNTLSRAAPWNTLSRGAPWITLSREAPWNTLSRAAPWRYGHYTPYTLSYLTGLGNSSRDGIS
ncbi:hypothetical protein R1sor_009245 [Riccia sorocarpa]|uniref:Uncharacterized protein n=1 Tax=Riccia sorocarpa TaxID=122646 RepID=A0ABD3H773_9MARC